MTGPWPMYNLSQNLISPSKWEFNTYRSQWRRLPSALFKIFLDSVFYSTKIFYSTNNLWVPHVSVIVLGNENPIGNKTDRNLCPHGGDILLRVLGVKADLTPTPPSPSVLQVSKLKVTGLAWPIWAFSPLFWILGNHQIVAIVHVVGKIMSPKDVLLLILGTCNCVTLNGKRELCRCN